MACAWSEEEYYNEMVKRNIGVYTNEEQEKLRKKGRICISVPHEISSRRSHCDKSVKRNK